MMTRPRTVLAAAVLVVAATGTPGAQAPQTPVPPAKPDTPAVTRHIDAARKAAGSDWGPAVEFICSVNASRANRPDDPLIEPTKLFDNLYAIGRIGTVVYAITTSEGIVLIDSGYADQIDSVLLPGMKTLGLDPANVKYVLLGHGHGDHFGGAAYFQQRGARVVSSEPDWKLMDTPPAQGAPAGPPAPRRDVVAVEGQGIKVGDVTFTPVLIPGHTPGSLAYIFPVREGRNTHTAGLYGGTILTPGRISDEGMKQYISSIAHYREFARKMNVDVELQNHPLYDGMEAKLARLKERKPGSPHPFVVGRDGYDRFLTVMSECTQAQLERRKLS